MHLYRCVKFKHTLLRSTQKITNALKRKNLKSIRCISFFDNTHLACVKYLQLLKCMKIVPYDRYFVSKMGKAITSLFNKFKRIFNHH